ncbi:helix-turn-helix transcriptional regulator [Paenibacillus sp. FSL E2-0151]|uniref:helix-turn-helix domain-containing protein n=1 Tax=Paenibacillus sp. FSL E2-0151 TaxID=2921357 RepID=UPI0030EC65F3
MSLPEDVGNRIRELRKAKGWTQEQLAEAAGLHYSYIGGVERGDRNISLETLEKIIKAIGTEAHELFRFEKDAKRQDVVDQYITLISDSTKEEIYTLVRINKEIISALNKKHN